MAEREEKELGRLTADIDKKLAIRVKVDAAANSKTKNEFVEEIIANHFSRVDSGKMAVHSS